MINKLTLKLLRGLSKALIRAGNRIEYFLARTDSNPDIKPADHPPEHWLEKVRTAAPFLYYKHQSLYNTDHSETDSKQNNHDFRIETNSDIKSTLFKNNSLNNLDNTSKIKSATELADSISKSRKQTIRSRFLLKPLSIFRKIVESNIEVIKPLPKNTVESYTIKSGQNQKPDVDYKKQKFSDQFQGNDTDGESIPITETPEITQFSDTAVKADTSKHRITTRPSINQQNTAEKQLPENSSSRNRTVEQEWLHLYPNPKINSKPLYRSEKRIKSVFQEISHQNNQRNGDHNLTHTQAKRQINMGVEKIEPGMGQNSTNSGHRRDELSNLTTHAQNLQSTEKTSYHELKPKTYNQTVAEKWPTLPDECEQNVGIKNDHWPDLPREIENNIEQYNLLPATESGKMKMRFQNRHLSNLEQRGRLWKE